MVTSGSFLRKRKSQQPSTEEQEHLVPTSTKKQPFHCQTLYMHATSAYLTVQKRQKFSKSGMSVWDKRTRARVNFD